MKSRDEIDKSFLAEDAFKIWKSRAKHATKSITIFSPYLDHIARSVMRFSDLPNDRKTIVTSIDAETLLQSPQQLRALKTLLQDGYEVRELPGLHAKVLLIDDSLVTVGSQNFTKRGRKNKECTAVGQPSIGRSIFAKQLIKWRSSSKLVEEKIIDLLLEMLGPAMRKRKKLAGEVDELVQKCRKSWLQEKLEEEKQKKIAAEREIAFVISHKMLTERAENSTVRLSSGPIYAMVRHVSGDNFYSYESLRVHSAGKLTEWDEIDEAGILHTRNLARLSMYPAFLADSGRMAFVRVADSCITYFRSSIDWTGKTFALGDLVLNVSLTFPEHDTYRRNILVDLKAEGIGRCRLPIRYSDVDTKLVIEDVEIEGNGFEDGNLFEESIRIKLLSAPDTIEELLKEFLSHFTYNTLGRDHKNVRDYLDKIHYTIFVIEIRSTPVIFIKEDWPEGG